MNFRDYKKFVPSGVYHIINRGNDKRTIFENHDDYMFFMLRLNQNLSLAPIEPKKGRYRIKPLPPCSFDLIGYCLMPNHFHLLIRQNFDIPITRLLAKVCTSYSKYYNKKYERIGTLFQDQFKSVPVNTNEQLQQVMVYIYNNPVKAGLVKDPGEYPYCKMGSLL